MWIIFRKGDACNSLGKNYALVGPYNVFKIKGEQAFNNKIVTALPIHLNKSRAQLGLVVDSVCDDQNPPTSIDDINGILNDFVGLARTSPSDPEFVRQN